MADERDSLASIQQRECLPTPAFRHAQIRERSRTGDAVLCLEGVRKEYGPSVVALDEIGFAVERGEWVAVMGPSGSGKTTLLNLLGCLDSPTTGQVLIEGTDVAGFSQRELTRFRAEKVGFIFQQFHLIPYLTALENVMMAQYFHSMTDEAEAIQALARVGLADRAQHLPSQLSGGEQQRVAIARALINQPSLLLADEPTGNLDARNEEIVMGLLRELHAEGNTIVMVTHDEIIGRMADRRILLEHGRIVQSVVFSFEEETAFDEVLEQLWVLEEDSVEARPELLQFNGGGNWKLLPVMEQIGLLCADRPVLQMTAEGRQRAATIIRRHRLAERLFADTFDIRDEQQLESNACTFEHILSPEVTERICSFLHHPKQCPHGSPIPPGPCCVESR
ncbi:MAG: ATP-binding cassette domain-containing protein [Acidobacteria bacterium]|nr:ATP-binding cassette domain-containing protein [Acidobacteriota bacterium]